MGDYYFVLCNIRVSTAVKRIVLCVQYSNISRAADGRSVLHQLCYRDHSQRWWKESSCVCSDISLLLY